MAVSKDEILDAIAKMSLMDVVELISDMEKKFGVTAAAPVAVAAGPAAAAAAPVEEKTEFAVKLEGYEAGEKLKVRRAGRGGEGGKGARRRRAGGRRFFFNPACLGRTLSHARTLPTTHRSSRSSGARPAWA